MNLMTESTDTNYLRYGFLRRHIELRERFKQFQKWYKENYSITAREAVCDYFRDPEIETKEGLMRQYMFEFLEAAGPMFKLYDAAKVYNCQPRVFRTPLYHTYVKWVRKLDATLKIAMRRDYYFTENMTWMAELRAAIPNPPPGAWLTRWKYMLLGPARNDVEAFFKKVEKWMR
uniref:Uncharacterized protein n=1 Tax=Bracon brevicornis TaxID=1563983 RepID=A0A6V7KVR3_9HYME